MNVSGGVELPVAYAFVGRRYQRFVYHLLPSIRGHLMDKLGRFDEARNEFERAASLAKNARERAMCNAGAP